MQYIQFETFLPYGGTSALFCRSRPYAANKTLLKPDFDVVMQYHWISLVTTVQDGQDTHWVEHKTSC